MALDTSQYVTDPKTGTTYINAAVAKQYGYVAPAATSTPASTPSSTPSSTPAPSQSNTGGQQSTWDLSSWYANNGAFTQQPVLTINGQRYTYNNPTDYINQLNQLKTAGNSGPLDQFISEFQNVSGQWNKSGTPTPTSTPASTPASTSTQAGYVTALYNGVQTTFTSADVAKQYGATNIQPLNAAPATTPTPTPTPTGNGVINPATGMLEHPASTPTPTPAQTPAPTPTPTPAPTANPNVGQAFNATMVNSPAPSGTSAGAPGSSGVSAGPTSGPQFYKPDPNNPTVYNAQGQPLDHASYLAQGGKPDYSNVTNGPVPNASASGNTPAGSGTSKPDNGAATTGAEASGISSSAIPDRLAPADFQKLYTDAYTSLGLATVKSTIEDYNKQLLDLNNKKSDELLNIKNNPWYSQGIRDREINNLDEKYALKISNLQGFLTLSNNLYNEGLQQAQFLTTGEFNQQQDAVTQRNTEIAAAQSKQQAIQKIANDNNLSTPYILDHGTVYRVSDGKGYGSASQFYQDAGVSTFQQAVDKKLLSQVDGNITAEHTQVLDMMGKYPDAGISPSDTLKEAQSKLPRSDIYAKATNITNSVTNPSTNPSTNSNTTGVISMDAQAVLEGRNTLFNIRQTMGRNQSAAAYMQALRQAITKIDPQFDFVASDAGGKSVSTAYVQRATAAINAVLPNIDTVVKLSDQVGRVGINIVDAVLQKGGVQINNQAITSFHEAQKLIADEIGVALGAGTVSDMKLQLGFDVTDPNVSQEIFAKNMSIVKEFVQNRLAGLQSLRYKSSTVDSNPVPQGAPPQGQIWVQDRQSGTYGSIPENEFDPKLYDKVSFNSAGNASASSVIPAAYSKSISSLVSKNPVPYGIINGYDITNYATDPKHEKSVYMQYQTLQRAKVSASSAQSIDGYIQKKFKGSPVTSKDIMDAAKHYNVDPLLMLSLMQVDSGFGTAGRAVRTHNPGNVGNTEDGSHSFKTWRDGVFAVAENLNRRRYTNVKTT